MPTLRRSAQRAGRRGIEAAQHRRASHHRPRGGGAIGGCCRRRHWRVPAASAAFDMPRSSAGTYPSGSAGREPRPAAGRSARHPRGRYARPTPSARARSGTRRSGSSRSGSGRARRPRAASCRRRSRCRRRRRYCPPTAASRRSWTTAPGCGPQTSGCHSGDCASPPRIFPAGARGAGHSRARPRAHRSARSRRRCPSWSRSSGDHVPTAGAALPAPCGRNGCD